MPRRGPHVHELFSLTGRVALVVGGSRNLGLDMAEALGDAGADLAITSRSAETATAVAAELATVTARRVLGLQLDAADEESVVSGFAKVVETYGRLDVVVVNAGGARLSGGGALIADRLLVDWDHVTALNLRGTFLCCREAVRHMRPAGQGSLITVGSISGVVGRDRSVYVGSDMVPNLPDYSAAKGGIIAFTRDLAAEIGASGLRANCLSPGGFERGQPAEFVRRYSAQTMLGRMGTDGLDLKGAVVFLASDASSYVTGHNLVVDGGFTAW
jgi:NAD(P)-dependent dehydrogenase (short-subunit alcohol dehydrogenase family)